MNPVLKTIHQHQDLSLPADELFGSQRAGPIAAIRELGIEAGSRVETGSWMEAWDAGLRRLLNVTVALLSLVILSPLLLVVALLIKVTSRGPVIFSQTRVGIDRRHSLSRGDGRRRVDYGGKLFTIYKFRTMRADPGSAVQIWATPNDSRITPIGRVLRKYRVDEFPQLFNVLRGDMNIVGPRPEQPKIFIEMREQVPGYARRQRVLPGITGWAQVNHHYDQCVEDVKRKVQLDVEYLSKASTLLDLRILLKTVPVVLFQRGGW
jgi:lipopolysaccharide/colanic/teichoic acid biosynthesis glycosyltransferase